MIKSIMKFILLQDNTSQHYQILVHTYLNLKFHNFGTSCKPDIRANLAAFGENHMKVVIFIGETFALQPQDHVY